MRWSIVASITAIIVSAPLAALASCVDFGNVTAWSRFDAHTIIVYQNQRPIALLKIPYCYVYSSAEIRMIKEYVCDWDKIIVDDDVCEITRVERI